MESQRRKIIEELYRTEQSYVFSLKNCMDYYYKYMKSKTYSHIIKEEDVEEIFKHLPDIFDVNWKFYLKLRELKESDQIENCIGEQLKKYIPFFKVYLMFISNYDHASRIIKKYEGRPDFDEMITDISKRIPTDNKLDLRSYLIMPVQRLPRYELLIKDLLNNTEESHPDYNNIKISSESIRNVTSIINEQTKQNDRREKVLKVKSLISGLHNIELVEPRRELILEGQLFVVRKKGNKPRYFYLFNDILIYGVGNQRITVRDWFYLKDINVQNNPFIENCFIIFTGLKENFSVVCETPEQKKLWFETLLKYIIDEKNRKDKNIEIEEQPKKGKKRKDSKRQKSENDLKVVSAMEAARSASLYYDFVSDHKREPMTKDSIEQKQGVEENTQFKQEHVKKEELKTSIEQKSHINKSREGEKLNGSQTVSQPIIKCVRKEKKKEENTAPPTQIFNKNLMDGLCGLMDDYVKKKQRHSISYSNDIDEPVSINETKKQNTISTGNSPGTSSKKGDNEWNVEMLGFDKEFKFGDFSNTEFDSTHEHKKVGTKQKTTNYNFVFDDNDFQFQEDKIPKKKPTQEENLEQFDFNSHETKHFRASSAAIFDDDQEKKDHLRSSSAQFNFEDSFLPSPKQQTTQVNFNQQPVQKQSLQPTTQIQSFQQPPKQKQSFQQPPKEKLQRQSLFNFDEPPKGQNVPVTRRSLVYNFTEEKPGTYYSDIYK